jgi:tRNA U54 and U55 pseudouridine synthase Pus10
LTKIQGETKIYNFRKLKNDKYFKQNEISRNMKPKKCELCSNEIKTTFLDKIIGTTIKTGEGESAKTHYICSSCQSEHKNSLKEKLSKS